MTEVVQSETQLCAWHPSVFRKTTETLTFFIFYRTQSTYFQLQNHAHDHLTSLGLRPALYLLYGQADFLVRCWMNDVDFDRFCGEMMRHHRRFEAHRYEDVLYVNGDGDGAQLSPKDDPDDEDHQTLLEEARALVKEEGELELDGSDSLVERLLDTGLLVPFDENRRGIRLFTLIEPIAPEARAPGQSLIDSLQQYRLSGRSPRFSQVTYHRRRGVKADPADRYLISGVSSEYHDMHEIVQHIGDVVEQCGYWTRTHIVARPLSPENDRVFLRRK
jgi:hypothetical protein